jgi:thymidylate synthase
MTNKGLYWKGITTELLWFLRGDNDIKFLKDNKVSIWDKDAYNWYLNENEGLNPDALLDFESFQKLGYGSVGQNYSVQWRNFNGNTDQITNLINEMREDIMSSRLKVNAWNPSELKKTALPPCHDGFQVVGVPLTFSERMAYAEKKMLVVGYSGKKFDNESKAKMIETLNDNDVPEFGFELMWNQRSCDLFLGIPFNIASYSLLAKMLEEVTGYPALAIEGSLKCVHFYENQYTATKELLSRNPNKHPNCELMIVGSARRPQKDITIDEFLDKNPYYNFQLIGYECDESIKVEMLAPNKI